MGSTARQHEPDLAVAKGAALFALLRTVRPGGGRGGRPPEAVAAKTGSDRSGGGAAGRDAGGHRGSARFGVKGIDGRDPLGG